MIKFTTYAWCLEAYRDQGVPARIFPLCNTEGVLRDQALVTVHASEDGYVTPGSSVVFSEALERLDQGEWSRLFVVCCHPAKVKSNEPWVQDDRITIVGTWEGKTGAGWEIKSRYTGSLTVFPG